MMATKKPNTAKASGAQAYIEALRKIGADKQTIKDAEAAAKRASDRKSRQLVGAAGK